MFKKAFLVCPILVSLLVLGPAIGQESVEKQPKSKPVIYLTFDDGPSADEVTERILEVLAEYDAKATFFVTGLRAQSAPEKIAKIVSAGHALGNHALSHRNLTTLPDHQVAEEFSMTNDYVYAAGGPTVSCFRAPFGETDQRVNAIASRMGMRSIGWTIDTRDWDAYTDADDLAVQLEDSYHESIVLMHDGPNSRWRTLGVFSRWMQDSGDLYDFQALPACVKSVTESFVSLDTQLLETDVEAESEVDDKTISQIIRKLGVYEFSLHPEVVAQSESQYTTY